MKMRVLILLLFTPFIFKAQENIIQPPVIVAKIALGETVVFENTAVTFLKVNEDSRCPSDVVCMWAGQAKVSVSISLNDETTEKELIFHGTHFGSESENTLFVSDSKSYIGYRLSPYPISTESADKRKYTLEILIK